MLVRVIGYIVVICMHYTHFCAIFNRETRARVDLGATAVQLERANARHKHHTVGHKLRVAALDVEELLHANIGAKAGLGHLIHFIHI